MLLARALRNEQCEDNAEDDAMHEMCEPASNASLKAGVADSALGTVISRATSLRNDVKRSFRESVQNLLSWALSSERRNIDQLMQEIDVLFV